MNHAKEAISLPEARAVMKRLEQAFSQRKDDANTTTKWLIASVLFENRLNLSTRMDGDVQVGNTLWYDHPMAIEALLTEVQDDLLAVILSDWVYRMNTTEIDTVELLWKFYRMPQGC